MQICEYVGKYFSPRFWNAPQKNKNFKIDCNIGIQCLQSCFWVAIGGSQKRLHLPKPFASRLLRFNVRWWCYFHFETWHEKKPWNEMFYRRNRIPKRYSTPDCGLDICQIQSDCNIKQSFISKPNNHKFTESVRGLRK